MAVKHSLTKKQRLLRVLADLQKRGMKVFPASQLETEFKAVAA